VPRERVTEGQNGTKPRNDREATKMGTSTSRTVEDLASDAYIALQEAQEAVERLTDRIDALANHPDEPEVFWAREATEAAIKSLDKVGATLPPDGLYKKTGETWAASQ
jgi:hypothetical protein